MIAYLGKCELSTWTKVCFAHKKPRLTQTYLQGVLRTIFLISLSFKTRVWFTYRVHHFQISVVIHSRFCKTRLLILCTSNIQTKNILDSKEVTVRPFSGCKLSWTILALFWAGPKSKSVWLSSTVVFVAYPWHRRCYRNPATPPKSLLVPERP